MRLLMMGTGPFAVPTFQTLIEHHGHDVLALVTRPDKPTHGRRNEVVNPMRDVAEAAGLPVFEPASVNTPEFVSKIGELAPDLLVVCDFGQILSADCLAAAPKGGINLHGSLLPKYRGAAPVNWAIIRGETETGVTVIHMTPGLDAGPILAARTTPIDPDETAPQLEARLAQLGAAATLEGMEKLTGYQSDQPSPGAPQDLSRVTKAPRLKKEDGRVDWSFAAEAIYNRFRGLQPWPGLFTELPREGGQPLRLILSGLRPAEGAFDPDRPPGEIVAVSREAIHVATGRGFVAVTQVQPAGKKPMPVAAFLNGHPVRVGERLGG